VKFGINDLHTVLGFVSMGTGKAVCRETVRHFESEECHGKLCVCCGAFGPGAGHEWLLGSAEATLFVRKMMTS